MSLIEVRDEGDIRWIGLNRPNKRNAIGSQDKYDRMTAFPDRRRDG